MHNEPIDSLDKTGIDDDEEAGVGASTDAGDDDDDELFTLTEENSLADEIDQLSLMSETELYNWVAENSYERITDILAYAMHYR